MGYLLGIGQQGIRGISLISHTNLVFDSVMQHVPTGLCVVSVASRHGPGVYWVMSSKKILKMNIILLCKNIEKLFKIAEKCDRSRLREKIQN